MSWQWQLGFNVRRKVGVAEVISAVIGLAIRNRQGPTVTKALHKIWIRNIRPSKCDQVSAPGVDGFLRPFQRVLAGERATMGPAYIIQDLRAGFPCR